MGRPSIQDQFTKMPITRQAKYMRRQAAKGLCYFCAQPAVAGGRCEQHNEKLALRRQAATPKEKRRPGVGRWLAGLGC